MWLRIERGDLRIGVVDCDHGIGVIVRGEPERRLRLSSAELERMGYEDLALHRGELLNLMAPQTLAAWLSSSDGR